MDFFNSSSYFTRIRKHVLREKIEPPEYVSPSAFISQIEDAGFAVIGWKGFDFKPFQGYSFMSRLRCLDPGFVQERFTRLVESKVEPRIPWVMPIKPRQSFSPRDHGPSNNAW